MLVTRQNLMDDILKAEMVSSIQPLLLDRVKRAAENGTHPHLLKRFLERFAGDLIFELGQEHTEKERSNLREAMHALAMKDTGILG
jgi:hypothetical protein